MPCLFIIPLFARPIFNRLLLHKIAELATIMVEQNPTSLAQVGGVGGVAQGLNTSLSMGLPAYEFEAAIKDGETSSMSSLDSDMSIHGTSGAVKVNEKDPEFQNTPIGKRVTAFSTNVLPIKPRTSFLALLFEALKDPQLLILAFMAVLSLTIYLFVESGEAAHNENEPPGWVEGAAILTAVFGVALVTAGNDYSKDTQFRHLEQQSNIITVKVIRCGDLEEIPSHELMVGDVVELHTGDAIPADGLFISGHDLAASEAVMTGETTDVSKNKDAPFLLSGCQIVRGTGRMLVTAVGVYSQWGQLYVQLDRESDPTPLQQSLTATAKTIGIIGLVFATITFVLLLINYFVTSGSYDSETTPTVDAINAIIKAFVLAVTIVVVAVPEGLPLAVTISLAYSMKKMMKTNNLVRKLAACETMGGATNICSDKTGTLTQNKMTAMQAYVGGSFYGTLPPPMQNSRGEAVHTASLGDSLTNQLHPANARPLKRTSPHIMVFHEGVALNTTGLLSVNEVTGLPDHHGNATECALLVMSASMGADYASLRAQHDANIAMRYTFSSAKKRMSTLIKGGTPAHEGAPAPAYRLHTKGAWEIILDRCVSQTSADGSAPTPITEATRAVLVKTATSMASQGLRTVAVAYRDFEPDTPWDPIWDSPHGAPEEELVLLAIVGIKDPLRVEVTSSVAQCQAAGIMVRMVTGDNILTAKRIARDCGILSDGGIALEGKDFRQLSEAAVVAQLPNLQVLARSTPADKLRLVQILRNQGEVVAVTGDGTNDGPALKEADVGFAMGISGTEVAKKACDIVIMDDNFASIVSAVMWGRSVYDNIRKFVQFQLTVNIVALCIAVLGSATGRGSPIETVQLLWVNLIMDTMAALALGTQEPTPELLDRKPHGRHTPLISRHMWRDIIGQSMYQFTLLVVLLYAGAPLLGVTDGYTQVDGGRLLEIQPTEHYTIIFNTFVWMQIFNEINSRSVNGELNVFKGLGDNAIFKAVLVVTVFTQIMLVQLAGSFLWTAPLSFLQWVICIALGAVSLPLAYLIRSWVPIGNDPNAPIAFISQVGQALKLTRQDSTDSMDSMDKDAVENDLDHSLPVMEPQENSLKPSKSTKSQMMRNASSAWTSPDSLAVESHTMDTPNIKPVDSGTSSGTSLPLPDLVFPTRPEEEAALDPEAVSSGDASHPTEESSSDHGDGPASADDTPSVVGEAAAVIDGDSSAPGETPAIDEALDPEPTLPNSVIGE